jgi:hypothetical protein
MVGVDRVEGVLDVVLQYLLLSKNVHNVHLDSTFA